jgi:F-box/TPR repeat protein Pof3
MRTWPLLPPTLTHLVVSHNIPLTIRAEDLDPIPLPLLELFACHSTFLTPSNLKKITEASIRAGNLKTLLIGSRDTDFENTLVTDEFPAAETLEELSLAEMILGDERMMQIVSLYPKLQKLDASATKITGVAVKHFVNRGIRWLRLNECEEVSSDAVDWARGKGVEVEYLFPSRGGLGRMARFGESAFTRGF